jgi:hypothetical protein
MPGHNITKKMHDGEGIIADPGNAGTITIFKSPSLVRLVSTAAETRTLGRPTKQNVDCLLHFITDGGDITLTVTGGFNELGSSTFTFSDAGQWVLFRSCMSSAGTYFWQKISDYAVGDQGAIKGEVVITTNVISATENGRTYYLDLAAGFTSTLPAPALGLSYRFIVKTAPTGAPYVITTTSGSNLLYGMMLERAGTAGVAGAAQDTFNFVHTQSIIGDWVEFYSDGTNWYYRGMVDVAAGNTVAVT